MKLTAEQWDARGWALTEAAEHLEQEWTSDTDERAQGVIIGQRLRREAQQCFERADDLAGE